MTDYPAIGYMDDVAPLVQRIEPSWGNAIRDRTVQTFATTGDRDAAIPEPASGMTAFIAGEAALTVYNGMAWSPPWRLPWGVLPDGVAKSVANQGPFTTADIADLSVSVTVPFANRLIRVRAHGVLSPDGSSAVGQWRLDEDGAQKQRRNFPSDGGFDIPVVLEVTLTPAVGVHVYNVSAGRSGGDAHNWTSIADADFPAELTVEDVGPAGDPA